MRLEKVFRVSAYLTAALATVALGHAEEPFLPGITWFSLGIGMLFFVAFAIEKRWALSLRASNLLAVLVVVGAGLWLPYQFFHTATQLIELSGLLVILPYLGPILMVLLLLESFGTKRQSSFWWIHALGVLEIGLGCILASDLVFGGILSAYVICAVWSMYLFYLQRGLSNDHAGAADPRASIPGRTQGLWPAGRIAVVAMIVAMVLFLLTPQRGSKRWDPLALAGTFEPPARTGFTTNVDLNKTGTIEVNDDIAMEVDVEDANHRPKTDLPTDQRWRGAVREIYEHGRWLQPTDLIAAGAQQRALEQDSLPDYGPSQYFFNFKVDTREAQGLFLADPVVLDPKTKLTPVVALQQKAGSPLKWIRNDGSLLLVASPGQTQWRYRQVTIPLPELDVGPSLFAQIRNGAVQFATEIDTKSPRLLMQSVPQLGPWARDLLQRLVADGKLTKEDAEIVGSDPKRPRLKTPERFEKVARAVSAYLSSSGGFGYSLRLGRHDPKIDPVADFLLNTKQGNCELYATALVLVLRAYGIPTRLVMGYQGAENLGNGHYVVRQWHAHSWVEAIIRRQTPAGRRLYWLTLDPTPAAAAEADQAEPSWQRWWHDTRRGVRSVWRNFIVEYGSEQQQEVTSAMTSGLQAGGFARGSGGGGFAGLPWWLQAIGISLVVFVAFLGWRLLKRLRWRRDTAETGPGRNRLSDQQMLASSLYARLVSVLANRRGLKPGPGETPEEFGRAAESLLAEQEITATHALLPAKIVQLFYRARFGNLALSEIEQTEAEQSIAVLESALAAASGPKT
jgi:hypothetical protein